MNSWFYNVLKLLCCDVRLLLLKLPYVASRKLKKVLSFESMHISCTINLRKSNKFLNNFYKSFERKNKGTLSLQSLTLFNLLQLNIFYIRFSVFHSAPLSVSYFSTTHDHMCHPSPSNIAWTPAQWTVKFTSLKENSMNKLTMHLVYLPVL